MPSTLTRAITRPISYLLPERLARLIARLSSGRFVKEFDGVATDRFLELLLRGMDLAFALSRAYRRNLNGFRGRYLFRTADDSVQAAAVFQDGDMKVLREGIEDWDTRVTFKNTAALRVYLFSGGQDILNSILENEVEVDGNLNLVYKFGFMAKDVARRLGVS